MTATSEAEKNEGLWAKGSHRLAGLVSAGLGSGFLPAAAGTWGSFAAGLVWWLLAYSSRRPAEMAVLLALASFLAGLLFIPQVLAELPCDQIQRTKGKVDPSFIVIDEWAGMALPLIVCRPDQPLRILFAFVLFRIFDIIKLGPVRRLERLPGAWGILLDDILAGLMAMLFLRTLVFGFSYE